MSPKAFRGTVPIFLLCLIAGLGSGWMYYQAEADADARVQHIEPNAQTGTSMATVVGDVALAHTAQFLPLDGNGKLVGAGSLEKQVDRVLENVRLALAEVDASFPDLVKLNVYVTRDAARSRIQNMFASKFPDNARPAVSFVTGQLPSPNAMVAMDAVAVTPQAHDDVAFYHSDELYGEDERGHISILPPGGKVFLSGQAAEGDLLEATRGTMEGLHATLAYLGLSSEDVVQVKAFLTPIADAESVEAQIAEYYRHSPTPPVVSVEWTHSDLPTEIELIASREGTAPADSPSETVSYITPPGMSAISTFSRVAEVHSGGLMFVSGLYGEAGEDAEGQVRTMFDTLDRLVSKSGSDFDNLAKATYYYSTGEASSALNEVRGEFYDPDRPPTSSKIVVQSVGKPGTTVTFDMIGAVTNPQ